MVQFGSNSIPIKPWPCMHNPQDLHSTFNKYANCKSMELLRRLCMDWGRDSCSDVLRCVPHLHWCAQDTSTNICQAISSVLQVRGMGMRWWWFDGSMVGCILCSVPQCKRSILRMQPSNRSVRSFVRRSGWSIEPKQAAAGVEIGWVDYHEFGIQPVLAGVAVVSIAT